MMPKSLLLVVTALLLAACQQAPVRDERSPYSRIPVGSRIELHQGLDVPRGEARVFLQEGKVRAKSRLNRYYPHCNFEVREVSQGATRIEPGTFLVTQVTEGAEMVVRRQGPLRRVGFSADGDSPSMITRFVYHWLGSESQPGVLRLTCHGGFADPHEAQFPGVGEIRKVLGGLATVHLAGGLRGE